MCRFSDMCSGDSGSALWETETPLGETEPISTVLGISSQSLAETCGIASLSHKIAHEDVLKWISKNWKK